jgi:hypothetical protein
MDSSDLKKDQPPSAPEDPDKKKKKEEKVLFHHHLISFLLIQIRFALMGFKQNLCFFNPIFLNPNV